MSSADEDDVMIKLDACVDVETKVVESLDDELMITAETFTSKCSVTGPEDKKQQNDDNEANNSKLAPTDSKAWGHNTFDDSSNFKVSLESKKIRTDSSDGSFPKRASFYDSYVNLCVPKINCSEKIVFCLDMSSDMDQIPFKLGDGSQHSPLSMVKRTIELFVENKHFISRKHEYSLMVLYETATWVREFTNDPKELIDSLDDLNETQTCSTCDLSSIASLLSEKYQLVVPTNVRIISHVLRVILIYGRSNCMVHFSNEESQEFLTKFPFLFLDIIYIHEPPSDENKCQEIYEKLCDLDEHNKSYIFEVTRNTTKLHNSMAKLLAHSLQRCPQKDSFYKIRVPAALETE